MSVEKRDLVPDEEILRAIFSGVDIKPTDCKIISTTFESCTFSIHPKTAALPDHPKDLLVRLEVSGRHLDQVVALQKLANGKLHDLVPLVVSDGTTATADGRQVEYAVSEYCTGTVPLEEIWNTLDQSNQMRLIDLVVCAMEKLHEIDSSNIQRVGAQSDNASVGGPKTGYSSNIEQFLDGILPPSDPKPRNWKFQKVDDGILLVSDFQDVGQVQLTRAELDELKDNIVFCHNDLEPRNILVRRSTESYDLAAIVDWEMAGFYPFAYEYGFKDNVLGSSNLSFSWYSLFKKQASRLLPQNGCHVRFIKALRVISESRRKGMTRNVGVRFQKKWVEDQNLEISPDILRGWVRKAGTKDPGNFSKEDKDNLELEVMRELGLE
ncbi:hypothetical protein BDP55DRAFT_697419 [Colletotrichum godetiae]|uniref:Aminoglycoside phosphotransferase domain-containing protein n=1 Tax=Colletotrichum godetiae TaxID=1209918 RepID=A0AAJ0ADP8_9PEZI|nr:uncharacterized protein BDP55DRAFT_697419 [Colletotrichum godetiae]KAK1659812.1 hypothetical protein BDP55DRAFT_697419 [Colletotrichum godetiae]